VISFVSRWVFRVDGQPARSSFSLDVVYNGTLEP